MTAACALVRARVFDEVGGFSRAFPLNYNDVDFCLKVRRRATRSCTAPRRSTTSSRMSRDNTVHDWEKALITRRWGDYREVPERYSTNVHSVVRSQERLRGQGRGAPGLDSRTPAHTDGTRPVI